MFRIRGTRSVFLGHPLQSLHTGSEVSDNVGLQVNVNWFDKQMLLDQLFGFLV